MRKEEIKLFPFADDMTVCGENLKNTTKKEKLLELINDYSKFIVYKINTQSQSHFYVLSLNMQEKN